MATSWSSRLATGIHTCPSQAFSYMTGRSWHPDSSEQNHSAWEGSHYGFNRYLGKHDSEGGSYHFTSVATYGASVSSKALMVSYTDRIRRPTSFIFLGDRPVYSHGGQDPRVLLWRKGTGFTGVGLGMNHGAPSPVNVNWNGAGGSYAYATRSQSNLVWLDGHGNTIDRAYNDTTLSTGNWQRYWLDAN